ncbi:hypothetical protein SK128_007636, partial [Halocaridina rubra]
VEANCITSFINTLTNSTTMEHGRYMHTPSPGVARSKNYGKRRVMEYKTSHDKSSRDTERSSTRVAIYGDSLTKYLAQDLSRNDFRSWTVACGRGMSIDDITAHAVDAELHSEGVLILQGGGNSLTAFGERDTWKLIKRCLKSVRKTYPLAKIGVLGITVRPGEGEEFEKTRRLTNQRISRKILRMNKKFKKYHWGSVEYICMDGIIEESKIGKDGIHFNQEGYQLFNERIMKFINSSLSQKEDLSFSPKHSGNYLSKWSPASSRSPLVSATPSRKRRRSHDI